MKTAILPEDVLTSAPPDFRTVLPGPEVAYWAGERRPAHRVARRLFGRTLSGPELAGLAGAPEDAALRVGTLDGALYLDADEMHTRGYRAVVLVGRGAAGPVIVNHAVHILRKAEQRRGLGLRMFCRQLAFAESLGVAVIRTIAGRGPGENGYYTWPRFGFDGRLPQAICRTLPAPFQGAARVLDLMESRAGRRWWRRHGVSLPVAFAVAPGSRSRRVLQGYLREKLVAGFRHAPT
jgi:hypothetical protein